MGDTQSWPHVVTTQQCLRALLPVLLLDGFHTPWGPQDVAAMLPSVLCRDGVHGEAGLGRHGAQGSPASLQLNEN